SGGQPPGWRALVTEREPRAALEAHELSAIGRRSAVAARQGLRRRGFLPPLGRGGLLLVRVRVDDGAHRLRPVVASPWSCTPPFAFAAGTPVVRPSASSESASSAGG